MGDAFGTFFVLLDYRSTRLQDEETAQDITECWRVAWRGCARGPVAQNGDVDGNGGGGEFILAGPVGRGQEDHRLPRSTYSRVRVAPWTTKGAAEISLVLVRARGGVGCA